MTDQDKKMKTMFLEEGKELLQSLEQRFTRLEGDPEDSEAILETYRAFHTLKGMAGTFGLSVLSNLFHKLEFFVQEIRDHKVQVSKEIIKMFFQGLDVIEGSLAEIEEKDQYDEERVKKFIESIGSTGNVTSVAVEDKEDITRKARMREIFEQYGMQELGSEEINFADEEQRYYEINIKLVEDVKLRTTRVLVIIKYLIAGAEALGKIIQTYPPLFDLVEGKFGLDFKLIFQSASSGGDIKDRINRSDEIANVHITEIQAEEAKKQVKRVEIEVQAQKEIQEFKKFTKISNVRVDVTKLDELMEIIGELLINTKQLQAISSQKGIGDLKNNIHAIENLVMILQDDILQMQLVPVDTIFRRFPRMVRSLSQQENKDVKFNVVGSDMLVDRKILDEINEALVHLIRNSVSHGIETVRERLLKNKPQVGTITLAARQEKNMLAIDVIDDGHGIDIEKVKQTALEKGLLTAEEAQAVTQEDAFRLIFNAGFSTKKGSEVSEVSGRGIGLNTVRERVDHLGGIVNITSKIDKGTTFTLLLPMSMSIIKALLVRVGTEKFSIPLDDVQYIYHLSQSEIQDINGVKFIKIQGSNIPLYDLGQIFNLETDSKQRLIDRQFVDAVFIERGSRRFCLAVEEFLEQTEIVVKRVEELTKYVKGVSGATILANGTVSLILDPFTIVSN